MAQFKKELSLIRLKRKSKFDMKAFYYMMHEWMVQEQWASRDDKKFPEIFAGRNDAAAGGSEVWWFWRPKKPSNKFMQWELKINAHIMFLRNVEEVVDGKKFKTNHGDLEVWIRVVHVLDPGKAWRNHSILKHFVNLYVNRLYKKEIEMDKLQLKNEAYRFQEAMKAFLGIMTANKESEHQGRFFPKGGVGE